MPNPVFSIPIGFMWTGHANPPFFLFLHFSYPMNQRSPKSQFYLSICGQSFRFPLISRVRVSATSSSCICWAGLLPPSGWAPNRPRLGFPSGPANSYPKINNKPKPAAKLRMALLYPTASPLLINSHHTSCCVPWSANTDDVSETWATF